MSRSDVNSPVATLHRQTVWHHDVGLLTAVWLFMTAVYVIGGAYDTDDFGLWHRLVFWLLVAGLLVFQPAFLERLFSRFTPVSRIGGWISAFCAVLVAIPLASLEIHLLKSTPLLPRDPDPWIEFIPFIAAPVVTVSGFVLFLRFAWEQRFLEPRGQRQDTAGVARDPDALIGAETLYVRAQDHYLEIRRETGRRFVRGRLADIADNGTAFGLSPHRSWWVADRAVEGYFRAGRDIRLVLVDGTQLPVGRAKVEEVRHRGWMKNRIEPHRQA
ncbi:LytTR family DNA-binding domain-containing protein [Hyphobacterium sp. HN65]|uniref:LytTR family DNA-binding domain-containing protein n=1 Tax=Hyphobacterium lacteum TaxID=3116575 RepID=A0ABU7LSH4_9PROT|nr:LytTR family DNA-binding domain-containing protein [Hyphobacterium sp. HN65]MEE2526539.1 LytTR family DNA-binding domain-containing protein [Hyphobacterium sp. HN65]